MYNNKTERKFRVYGLILATKPHRKQASTKREFCEFRWSQSPSSACDLQLDLSDRIAELRKRGGEL